MPKRRSPVRHTVSGYYRRGKWVDSFERGKGKNRTKRKQVIVSEIDSLQIPKDHPLLRFAFNERRRWLLERGFMKIRELKEKLGDNFVKADVYGSFVSDESDPNDLDVVVWVKDPVGLISLKEERGVRVIYYLHGGDDPYSESMRESFEMLVKKGREKYGSEHRAYRLINKLRSLQ